MPSFPTSVFAPPTRSAGQTIQAAHMNDVQDEINAIEGGYRNGTAPLNSSGSTVTSLHVTNGSTFASGLQSSNSTISGGLNSSNSTLANLSVTGGSTLAGRLAVSSGLSVVGNSTLGSTITLGTIPYIMPSSGGSTGEVLTCVSTSGSTMTLEWRASAGSSTPDGVRAILDSTQTISSEVTVIQPLAAQGFITNSSMHSTGTNSSRVVPQSTGLYLVRGQIRYSVNSTGNRGLQLLDSSGGIIGQTLVQTSTSAEPVFLQASGIKRFDVVGGNIRLAANSIAASTLSVLATDTWLEVVKL